MKQPFCSQQLTLLFTVHFHEVMSFSNLALPLFVGCLLLLLLLPTATVASLSPSFRHHLINNGLLQEKTTENKGDERRHKWPSRVSIKQILDEFVDESSRNRYVINLGAQDGGNYDPVFELLSYEARVKKIWYSGIFVEASQEYKLQLQRVVKYFNKTGNMNVYIEYALPSTIVSLLERADCPLAPDVLKIDIDSVDLPVIQAILLNSTIHPKVIMAEINPDLPPPIIWAQKQIRPKRGLTFYGNYGTGAHALYDSMDAAGYVPVAVELGSLRGDCQLCEHNLFFVTKELYRSRTQGDAGTDITFLDFSRSFWINILKYSNDFRSHSKKQHRQYLKTDVNALSCIQLDMHRCPYTLMQRFGTRHPSFQGRDFTRWETWYDLQLLLMSAEGNTTAKTVLKVLSAQLKHMDVASGVMQSDALYVGHNPVVPSTYTSQFLA
jgi:hypothetical protein